ncbi:hypothetical protein MSAN_02280200 [Mycena sanguinolenta]|uniref:Protein kinase domain-containing protein n=1 Tax=Mycena sanguinolenta TaxID=230812 RepID=A0A8H6XA69_9AGAR|nr:hypothetical protein MSAN_02280200 [Mycena sanguinolenta]
MDPQADSDEDFIVLSTSDNVESVSYTGTVFPQAGGLTKNAKLLVKSFGLLPSFLGAKVTEFQASGTARTHTRKYSETMRRQIADHRSVTNYTYIINGGRGGSGGEGHNQGGDGGAGHSPIVYFGQPQAREPSASRTILLGDIILIKEFKEMRSSPQSSLVGRQTPRASVRRVYTAKLEGRQSGHMTVAMYEGDGAEEEWNQDLANYEAVRHPNIMQLYGLVSTKRLRGMVFHDELIPYDQFFGRFENSPILSTYIIGYCARESREATHYIVDVIGYPMKTSEWIQPSTGHLCLDLVHGGPEPSTKLPHLTDSASHIFPLENVPLDTPDSEDILISSFSNDQYHELCCWYPIARFQYFQVSTKHCVRPGVFRWDSQYGTCVRITEALMLPDELHWQDHGRVPDELLPTSWTRYDFPHMLSLKLELNLWFPSYEIRKPWLAQANHIFAELKEVAHVEDYVCIYQVYFTLRIADKHHDFRTCIEPHGCLYQWPACPAYWALDPSGADRLSTEDAEILGFPTIHIETTVHGCTWDRSVYKGLRQFHEGKGFDPDSREVARQLGYPLFEVSSSRVPFPAGEG